MAQASHPLRSRWLALAVGGLLIVAAVLLMMRWSQGATRGVARLLRAPPALPGLPHVPQTPHLPGAPHLPAAPVPAPQ